MHMRRVFEAQKTSLIAELLVRCGLGRLVMRSAALASRCTTRV